MNVYNDLFTNFEKETNGILKKAPGNIEQFALCSVYSKYKSIELLGEGTYGKVYKSENKFNGQICAIKFLKSSQMSGNYFLSALREIDILKKVDHENVATLIEVCYNENYSPFHYEYDFALVFQYYEYDLLKVIRNKSNELSENQKLYLMQQMLNGLDYIHNTGFMHRDLKPSNIAIDKNGKVKIIDFGLSRKIEFSLAAKRRTYSPNVVSVPYRAPEIVLGMSNYTTAIDIWSLGVIFVELYIRRLLFKCKSEIELLDLICSLCGSITINNWPEGYKFLFGKNMTMKRYPALCRQNLDTVIDNSSIVDMICCMLQLNPTSRHSAKLLAMNSVFKGNFIPEPINNF